jgi:hypothetical protein
MLQGIARLKHVGNAINQVSKVFHDGYKEITKGSQVLSYTDKQPGVKPVLNIVEFLLKIHHITLIMIYKKLMVLQQGSTDLHILFLIIHTI